MPRFAAALLTYSPASDDAYYLAVGVRGAATQRAERLEELVWSPSETFDSPSAAAAALDRFRPGFGGAVWQRYVVGVRPFLLDEQALIACKIVNWSTPLSGTRSREEAA